MKLNGRIRELLRSEDFAFTSFLTSHSRLQKGLVAAWRRKVLEKFVWTLKIKL